MHQVIIIPQELASMQAMLGDTFRETMLIEANELNGGHIETQLLKD